MISFCIYLLYHISSAFNWIKVKQSREKLWLSSGKSRTGLWICGMRLNSALGDPGQWSSTKVL